MNDSGTSLQKLKRFKESPYYRVTTTRKSLITEALEHNQDLRKRVLDMFEEEVLLKVTSDLFELRDEIGKVATKYNIKHSPGSTNRTIRTYAESYYFFRLDEENKV